MRIAITGGIGAGKSYVCKRLSKWGISVYDCDAAAKRLMRTSAPLQAALCSLVGPGVYVDGVLQKRVLAQFLLASPANNEAVNAVVHPAVAADYMQSGMEWLESAILFESGFHRRVKFDHIVCVTAPTEVRAQRIMARDGISHSQAMQWIDRQYNQDRVAAMCDYVIINDGSRDLDMQIENILNEINNKD